MIRENRLCARDAQAAILPAPKAASKQPAAKPAPRISTGGAPRELAPVQIGRFRLGHSRHFRFVCRASAYTPTAAQ
jgi:hypothetical protein